MADLHPDDMEELRELAALTTGPVKVAAPALAALLSEHDRQREEIGRLHEALSAVLADMPIIDCDRLHHAKEDRHGAGLCPVETRLEAAIDRASSALSDTTRGK